MPVEKRGAQCSGCTACAAVCPQQCITMKPDKMGFKYPQVDSARCTGCEACTKICPFTHDASAQSSVRAAYAARCVDRAEVRRSQSGGAFVALSDAVLNYGGVVYGAVYDATFRVAHVAARTADERNRMRGSKYVQSDLTGIIAQIKEDLRSGQRVMFSGTPCQVAAVKACVPRALQQHLYTMDIVCYGVAAPAVWQATIEWLERKEGRKLVEVNMRNKAHGGWRAGRETYCFEGVDKPRTYSFRFYNRIKFRPSCSECPFCSMQRAGDISVGDFWGIERTASRLGDDNEGCSLILVSSAKGSEWFEEAKQSLVYDAVDPSLCLQPCLTKPMPAHPRRDAYAADFAKRGLQYAMLRHGERGPLRVAKQMKASIEKLINKTKK